MDHDKYTLAPSVIADRARKLAEVGLYQQALELLQRNCVEAHVYPTRVEMSIPRAGKKRDYHLKPGHLIRKGKPKVQDREALGR